MAVGTHPYMWFMGSRSHEKGLNVRYRTFSPGWRFDIEHSDRTECSTLNIQPGLNVWWNFQTGLNIIHRTFMKNSSDCERKKIKLVPQVLCFSHNLSFFSIMTSINWIFRGTFYWGWVLAPIGFLYILVIVYLDIFQAAS